ncbi:MULTISPECIES: hypothetical protein [Comamonas]|uniref:hypothetical protein n=1 Tax=Comamonas TaxID=283 RepID=UPI0025802DB3|nr:MULTISPECIES: hypothetical protein [Comamonas]
MPHTLIALALLPTTSFASWQADLEYGQGDALGIVLFFYAFLVYVIVRDGFKESRGKGWRCLLTCLFVGYLIFSYSWALSIACLVFFVSFLQFCWEKMR